MKSEQTVELTCDNTCINTRCGRNDDLLNIEQAVRTVTDVTELFMKIGGLSKTFVQYVYINFILQILGYINVVPFKILPIRHNRLCPPPFPLLEAPLEFLSS